MRGERSWSPTQVMRVFARLAQRPEKLLRFGRGAVPTLGGR
jgi:hypothetical protein